MCRASGLHASGGARPEAAAARTRKDRSRPAAAADGGTDHPLVRRTEVPRCRSFASTAPRKNTSVRRWARQPPASAWATCCPCSRRLSGRITTGCKISWTTRFASPRTSTTCSRRSVLTGRPPKNGAGARTSDPRLPWPSSSVFSIPLQHLRLAQELRQIDLPAHLALYEFQAHFQLTQFSLERRKLRGHVVRHLGPGHLGVAELPLQGREQVERVAAAIGPRDLALLLS